MTLIRQRLCFYEVERDDDLDSIRTDLITCGAINIQSRVNEDKETAEIIFYVADVTAFRRAFGTTPSAK